MESAIMILFKLLLLYLSERLFERGLVLVLVADVECLDLIVLESVCGAWA